MPDPRDIKYELGKYVVRFFGGQAGPFGSRAMLELHGRLAKSPEGHAPPVIIDQKEVMAGCVWFYDEGKIIPPNSLTYNEGAQIHLPLVAMASVTDTLRYEKPVWLAHSLNGTDAYLFTWDEPVGEGERGEG